MTAITPTVAHPDVQQAYGGQGPAGASQPQAPGRSGESQGPSFAEVMEGAYESARTQLQDSREASMRAASGDANVQAVAEAVTDAQMTVETVTALRDKAVSAYRQILRMPI
jgi:flagellar hook-basal body complex protein FliE